MEQPRAYRGYLQDDLLDEARALWRDNGGSEAAWNVWSTRPGTAPAELAEGRWEKPTKPLPVFEQADLSGKTWRLQTMEAKSVLINLWATWCGPCQSELPKLQKLYDSVRGRADVQVITFNLDEDLGLVAPFVNEKGYTFLVLPAYSVVTGMFDGFGIPQNWIIDPQGKWRWTQIGFDSSDPKWAETMMEKLDSVKAGS